MAYITKKVASAMQRVGQEARIKSRMRPPITKQDVIDAYMRTRPHSKPKPSLGPKYDSKKRFR